jgi:uncharacterized protein YxeA
MLNMTKIITVGFLIAGGAMYCNADAVKESNNDDKIENLIKGAGFAEGFAGWYVSCKEAFSLNKVAGENILIVKRNPELKKNNYVKCSKGIKLSKDNVTGKKFTFGVTLKAINVSGKAYFAIREVDANGKTVAYQKINLKKRDKYDWKKITKTFTTSPKTVKLAIYIVARYLGEDDEIQAKNIYLYREK